MGYNGGPEKGYDPKTGLGRRCRLPGDRTPHNPRPQSPLAWEKLLAEVTEPPSISSMLSQFKGILLLWLASFLDYCIGDPWGWPHPVKFIGGVIHIAVNCILQRVTSSTGRRLWGLFWLYPSCLQVVLCHGW